MNAIGVIAVFLLVPILAVLSNGVIEIIRHKDRLHHWKEIPITSLLKQLIH